MAGAGEPGTPAARLFFAAGLAVLLGTVVLVVLLAGGESEVEAEPAPQACLEKWNGDDDALTKGRHASTFHVYDIVAVGYLSAAGEMNFDASSGPCTAVFGRSDLDPEREWAGFYLARGGWTSLSSLLDAGELALLQADALAQANATVVESGEFEPFSR